MELFYLFSIYFTISLILSLNLFLVNKTYSRNVKSIFLSYTDRCSYHILINNSSESICPYHILINNSNDIS